MKLIAISFHKSHTYLTVIDRKWWRHAVEKAANLLEHIPGGWRVNDPLIRFACGRDDKFDLTIDKATSYRYAQWDEWENFWHPDDPLPED